MYSGKYLFEGTFNAKAIIVVYFCFYKQNLKSTGGGILGANDCIFTNDRKESLNPIGILSVKD